MFHNNHKLSYQQQQFNFVNDRTSNANLNNTGTGSNIYDLDYKVTVHSLQPCE